MRSSSELPPALRGRAFLTTDVHGLSKRRLRGNDMQRPSRGVRAVGLDLGTVYGRCVAYRARMSPGQAFSHVTAAQIYRIPLPPWLDADEVLHVTVKESAEPPHVRGVVGHALTGVEARMRLVAGLPVCDPVSTWCQLASVLSLYDLVAAGDYLVSGRLTDAGREPPLATPQELRAGVARYAGHRGVRRLREAIERVRTGVDSRPETWTRLTLVDGGLPEPVVNEPIYDERGNRLGKPDLAYPWARVLFEYEGDEHRTSKVRFRADIHRRERFEAAKWRVIRVIADDLFTNPQAFLTRVRTILLQQAHAKP